MNKVTITIFGLLLLGIVGGGVFAFVGQESPVALSAGNLSGWTTTASLTQQDGEDVILPDMEDVVPEIITGNAIDADIVFRDNGVDSENINVEIAGGIATITTAGEYVISGKSTDGMIIVEYPGDEEVSLIFNGVHLESKVGPAIYIKESGDATIFISEDSVNFLSDSKIYDAEYAEEVTGVVYSKSDLDIEGEGVLVVYGNNNDGIAAKDDLDITDATLEVYALDDGIRGKDSIEFENANVSVVALGDGLKSDNNEDVDKGFIVFEDSEVGVWAGDDGIDAVNFIEFISGNTLVGRSYEGVEAMNIIMRDGDLVVYASDDGINIANTSEEKVAQTGGYGIQGPGDGTIVDGAIQIMGGSVTLHADADGFDSNGNAVMTGGTLVIHGPTTEREGPIDVDGTFEISGGTIFAIGSAEMAEVPDSASTQNTLQINFTDIQSAGTEIDITNIDGEVLASLTSIKEFYSVTFSSPELAQGETYSLVFDGDEHTTITLDSTVTIIGDDMKRGAGVGNQRGGGQRAVNSTAGVERPAPSAVADVQQARPNTQGATAPGNRGQSGRDPNGDITLPPDMEIPDGWEGWTDDEKSQYMEANRPQRPGPRQQP